MNLEQLEDLPTAVLIAITSEALNGFKFGDRKLKAEVARPLYSTLHCYKWNDLSNSFAKQLWTEEEAKGDGLLVSSGVALLEPFRAEKVVEKKKSNPKYAYELGRKPDNKDLYNSSKRMAGERTALILNVDRITKEGSKHFAHSSAFRADDPPALPPLAELHFGWK